MRAFMDEFDVVKAQTGGAEIVMSKRLPGADGAHSNGNGSGGHDAAPRTGA